MESFVNDAKDRGGKIATGGNRRGNQGYFFEPTVITDVPDDCKLMTQEPFGPLAPVVLFAGMGRGHRRAVAVGDWRLPIGQRQQPRG